MTLQAGPGDRSRHRAKWAPPPAVEGYWDLGFGTQDSRGAQ